MGQACCWGRGGGGGSGGALEWVTRGNEGNEGEGNEGEGNEGEGNEGWGGHLNTVEDLLRAAVDKRGGVAMLCWMPPQAMLTTALVRGGAIDEDVSDLTMMNAQVPPMTACVKALQGDLVKK